ncbi:hypothetical protein BU204_35990 [Actinophytocola xanthii]|uniref:HTH cro/C1-type domain-containing protein n=2 Tax=Actinophytocola xanthii TaxID=1912961 RepID=A0A1Q8BXT6_9PSEU|nr:hypothetical protein BU204_35990 [Actinophytocola xanthii]
MFSGPNELLKAARDAAGMTQAQVAECANAQVEAATSKPGAMDADYVGKLERGIHRWPNRDYRRALREVLQAASDADLGFFNPRSRIVTVVRSRQSESGGDDVERKAFLRVLAGSVAGMVLSDPLSEFAARATSANAGRRIGTSEVQQIRQMARMFANQDHLYGGGLSAQGVLTHLSTASDLLEGRFASEAVRQHLFSAVADLADTAGGMCFDAGTHQHAERCFRFAVGCATEAGDWALRAKALSGLANLSVHRSHQDDSLHDDSTRKARQDHALSFAELALVRADRLTPVVRSVMHTRHARALGIAHPGREAECFTALDVAARCFTQRDGDEPPWIAYYDEPHLARDSGRALLGLALNGGNYSQAQDHLAAAVAQFPSGYTRGKVLAIANLATLTMARDDPMHAVTLGSQAVTAASSVRSDRVLDALRQLRNAGRQYGRVPAVHELNQQIAQLLQAVAL